MKLQKTIKNGIVVVVVLLVSLVLFKPAIDTEFHNRYVDNLNAMETLSGSLVRNHLLVRQGQVKHYDFLEADLQKMTRTAQLSALVPPHVGKATLDSIQSASDEYLDNLGAIRQQVELSKRSIGLLNNSRAALQLLLVKLNEAVLNNQFTEKKLDTLALSVKINEALQQDSALRVVNPLLDELTSLGTIDRSLLAKIRLHAEMIDNFSQPLDRASAQLYQAIDHLNQPAAIRQAYIHRHQSVLKSTTWQLWASYTLAACLVVLSILLSMIGTRAQREAQAARLAADTARQNTEDKITETAKAVRCCNDVLEKLCQGDFSERVTDTYSGDLETLKKGVNGTADSVEFTMQELQRVLEAMQRGEFDSKIDERVTGEFRTQVELTNAALLSTVDGICDVMLDMRQGHFKRRISSEAQGSFEVIKHSVNDSLHVLNQSLGEIANVVEKQATGDFTRRISDQWPGEIGALAKSLNGTASKVEEMVTDIQQLSDQVAVASQTVLNNSVMMKSTSANQVDSIDTAVKTAQSVSVKIEQDRQSTQRALVLADESQSKTEECLSVSEQATQAMDSITRKTAEISAITATIETIASKTNLLSLNAAVEAARANEHGKGFSVVAGEVKALARMSAEASVSIGRIIQDTDKQVKLGSDSVRKTATGLTGIGDSIIDVKAISRDVSVAASEQLERMSAVTDNVTQICELSHHNAGLANENHTTAMSLDKLAIQMASMVAFFSGDRDGKDTASVKKAA